MFQDFLFSLSPSVVVENVREVLMSSGPEFQNQMVREIDHAVVETIHHPIGALFFAAAIIGSIYHSRKQRIKKLSLETKTYSGSCHCGKVTFDVDAPRHLVAWDCNCSICVMKKNWHFIVPYANFHLKTGADVLTEYRFNTKVARHVFCSKCGVQAYYRPRSNPDGVAVTLACVPAEQIESSEIRKFDGNNWESFYGSSGISAFSKANTEP